MKKKFDVTLQKKRNRHAKMLRPAADNIAQIKEEQHENTKYTSEELKLEEKS